MKAKILVLGLVLATVATVAIYPSLRGDAKVVVVQPPPLLPPVGANKIEVVFVLDTTGSMSGLIEAAKEKIWSIATTLSQANQAPEISMGLIAYRDRSDAYVTKVVDLSNDLDSMYATLMQFAADGGGDGPEDVNRALHDAIENVSWSNDQSAYKVVFLVGDAPPHMDYQDGPRYPEIVAAAKAKGIVVNTIQCGGMSETVEPWRHIAALGGGKYFTVEQAGSAVAIATPFDAEIATLAAKLDETRLYYGAGEERERMNAKVAATAELNAAASTEALARRGVFNSTASGLANLVGEQELVHDVTSGRVDLDAVPPASLPAPLVGLSVKEQAQVIAETAKRRAELQQQIAELAGERDAFIESKLEDLGGAKDSLDRQIYDAVRDQAAEKGLVYETGPKF